MLYEPITSYVILTIVGMAGVAWGLLLSALAGRRQEIATFLLPLVMMAQIVFSVPIAQHDRTYDSVGSAYSGFRVSPTIATKNAAVIPWAALASYLTVSRPADFALRSFAYHAPDSSQGVRYWNSISAALHIILWATGLLAATLATLLNPFSLSFRQREKSG